MALASIQNQPQVLTPHQPPKSPLAKPAEPPKTEVAKALQTKDKLEPSLLSKTWKGTKWGALAGAATIGGGATAALLYAGLSDATIPLAQKLAVLPAGLAGSLGFFGGIGATVGALGGAASAVVIGATIEDKKWAAAAGAAAGFAAGAAWGGSTVGDLTSIMLLGTAGAAIGALSSYKVSEMSH